jgi:PAS domain S-box-containing protein
MRGAAPGVPAPPLDPAAGAEVARVRVPSLVGGAAFVIDQGLRCLVAEGDAVRVAGLQPDEVVGRPLAEILDPWLAARLEPHCRLVLEGQPFVYEHEANGRAYITRGVPLPDDRGGVAAALVVTYDITDQQQAGALRRRGEEAFSALIEHAPFAIAVVDATFRLRATNQAADVLLQGITAPHGRAVAEIAAALWPASQVADVVRQFRHTLATGEPFVAPRRGTAAGTGTGPSRMEGYDWQLRRIALPDGTDGVVCYAYDLTPIRDAEHAATQATGERSKAEARLHDSETRLRLALDASGMGTFVWHLDESRGEPDARALELLGLTGAGGWGAVPLAALVHVDDRSACVRAIERALDPSGAGVLHQDFRRQDPDGTVRWLAISARTTFAGTPRRAVSLAGVIADIDDRKRIEAALREREEMLVDADRRKDEFLAVLAHELRNPLAPLRAGLELIRLSGDASPAVERTRAIMDRQVGHMVRLIDDLLDVSRITSGKIQLHRRPTPIDLLIATAVDANREAITTARLLLEIRLPDPPVWVDADPTRGVQIVSNVLHNAVKFSDPGGRIAVTAAVEAADGAAAALVLTIADTGVGITPEMLPRVFDLFTQDRATTGRSQAGLGIGLALARRLVEMHGGAIEARSGGPGCGSAITIRLPVSDADAPATAPLLRTSASASRHRVLVVDDNLDAAHAMAMVIAALGGDARVSGDGAGALALVAEWSPTLVLLDIGMPGMDGYETCRRVRAAMGNRIRIVALTGWGQEQDKRDAERAGFDAHLTKPADPAALERLLAEMPDPD